MRILVAGATGYVGSRLVPALLDAGHQVVAASSRPPQPGRYRWEGHGQPVEHVQMDATDPDQVRAAVTGAGSGGPVDAVCYLVHSLDVRGFAARDRLAASTVRDAVDEAGVPRLVYLSGLVPDVPEDRLSGHITSRLEVERILAGSTAATVSLRAGVVVGAGSTSFEIVRQTASLLLVQPVPRFLRSRVQPVAVDDVVKALVSVLVGPAAEVEGVVDIGGPDVVSYAGLLSTFSRAAGLPRVQLPVLGATVTLASLTAGLLSAAPYWTVAALVQSLRHDMVCRPGHTDPRVLDPATAVPLRRAVDDALRAEGVAGPEPSDPAWVHPSWLERTLVGTRLPGSTLLGAAVHVTDHRLRAVRRVLGGEEDRPRT